MKNFLKSSVAFLALIGEGEVSADEGRDVAAVRQSTHDMIEYNNLYDEQGNASLDQIIYWTWNARDSRWDVQDWRLVPTRAIGVDKPIFDQDVVFMNVRGVRKGIRQMVKVGEQEFKECIPTDRGVSMIPKKDHKTGEYVSTWDDKGVTRKTRTKIFRETFTQHDPEVENRELLPKDKRVPLPKHCP